MLKSETKFINNYIRSVLSFWTALSWKLEAYNLEIKTKKRNFICKPEMALNNVILKDRTCQRIEWKTSSCEICSIS